MIDWMRPVLALLILAAGVAHGEEVPRVPRWAPPAEGGVPWPVIPSPLERPVPLPQADAPPPPAPTKAGARVVAIVDAIRSSLTSSAYQHATNVREKEGIFHFDCSGMTAWILRRAAPGAMRRLSGRPVARDFARVIRTAPEAPRRGAWQRIARVADVMPGDVFAWQRPKGLPGHNTGHVGIVVDRPLAVPGLPGGFAVRLADSSSYTHQHDTRRNDPDGGFGEGTMVFLTDADGVVTHYGWAGTQSAWFVATRVEFGRVSR